jgi:hypothetical protein
MALAWQVVDPGVVVIDVVAPELDVLHERVSGRFF